MNLESVSTAALYTFSAFLQSDAAIIGIGSIFLVYRLQAMESSYQSALQMLATEHVLRPLMFAILSTNFPLACKLRVMFDYRSASRNSLIRIAAFSDPLKRHSIVLAIPPMGLFVVHCIMSAFFLRSVPGSDIDSLNAMMTATTVIFITSLVALSIAAIAVLLQDPHEFGQRYIPKESQISTFDEFESLFVTGPRCLHSVRYLRHDFRLLTNFDNDKYWAEFGISYTNRLTDFESTHKTGSMNYQELHELWDAFSTKPIDYLKPDIT